MTSKQVLLPLLNMCFLNLQIYLSKILRWTTAKVDIFIIFSHSKLSRSQFVFNGKNVVIELELSQKQYNCHYNQN